MLEALEDKEDSLWEMEEEDLSRYLRFEYPLRKREPSGGKRNVRKRENPKVRELSEGERTVRKRAHIPKERHQRGGGISRKIQSDPACTGLELLLVLLPQFWGSMRMQPPSRAAVLYENSIR